ncbi:MAG: pyridine nucleotide transhydrogenase [Planctomycetes bacterium]|nr:pyridine nucleotide transhydrogenase [Planctomycetota bacterium]
MKRALIGHTGFVGSNLLRAESFHATFNSQNVEELVGQTFDLVVCAGAPGVKWKANQDPDRDSDIIQRLQRCLAGCKARQVVLISTVDVYPRPLGVDESSHIDPQECHPYGRHRFMLEGFVAGRFPTTTVRLPGLFGRGLQKNVIYDLMHDNQVDRIHPESTFQYYDLEWLWGDVCRAKDGNLKTLNLSTEPIRTADLARQVFGRRLESDASGPPARYDFRSRHCGSMGGRDGYLRSASEVLSAMERFVTTEGGGA